MTALGISLLVVGAIVIVIEAHVPTLGILGGPGLIALGVLTALVLTAIGGGVLYASVRKGLAARRRPVRAGPERLIGHVGVVQSWASSGGKVLLDGALWRARHSWTLDDHQDEPLHPGDQVVVERLSGLTLGVRRAEDWELSAW